MYSVRDLYVPVDMSEALRLLSDIPNLIPLAGGTDVVVKLRNKGLKDVRLMSLKNLGLKGIEEREGGTITIGARSTFAEIARSVPVSVKLPSLKTAALAMGGPQVRNVATLGGNICNGAPSADGVPPLFALDAILVFESASGSRRVPVTDFYEGPGRVKRFTNELLVSIEIPLSATGRMGGAYIKFSTRRAMDLAILNCAATCLLNEEGLIENAAISLGVAAPTPIRCSAMEEALRGKRPTPQVIWECAGLALDASTPRTSWRASKEYREQLIRVLSARAFKKACELAERGRA